MLPLCLPVYASDKERRRSAMLPPSVTLIVTDLPAASRRQYLLSAAMPLPPPACRHTATQRLVVTALYARFVARSPARYSYRASPRHSVVYAAAPFTEGAEETFITMTELTDPTVYTSMPFSRALLPRTPNACRCRPLSPARTRAFIDTMSFVPPSKIHDADAGRLAPPFIFTMPLHRHAMPRQPTVR